MLAPLRPTRSPEQLDINPNRFELWYQPVYDVSSGQVLQNEVLLRWRDPQGSLRLPKDFMPMVAGAKAEQWLDRYVIAPSR